MKKTSIAFALVFALCLGEIVLESCSKAASAVVAATSATCTSSTKTFSDAAAAYSSDPTNVTKCQAYKTAATNYLSDCALYVSATDKANAQNSINSLSCK